MSEIIYINEVFISIDGEVNSAGQGRISTFVRLAGCNLKCSYCDVPDQVTKEMMSVNGLFDRIARVGCKKITITGGEPLLQSDAVFELIDMLLRHQYIVSVETNGTKRIPYLYQRKPGLCWVVDYKLEYDNLMLIDTFKDLPNHNWVKFVISSYKDYGSALCVVNDLRNLGCEAKIAFSPVFRYLKDRQMPVFDPSELLGWLIQDKIFNIYLNVQIHKLINVR